MQIETGKEDEFEEDDDADEPLPAETNGSVSDVSLVEEMRLVPKDPSVCILQISYSFIDVLVVVLLKFVCFYFMMVALLLLGNWCPLFDIPKGMLLYSSCSHRGFFVVSGGQRDLLECQMSLLIQIGVRLVFPMQWSAPCCSRYLSGTGRFLPRLAVSITEEHLNSIPCHDSGPPVSSAVRLRSIEPRCRSWYVHTF